MGLCYPNIFLITVSEINIELSREKLNDVQTEKELVKYMIDEFAL